MTFEIVIERSAQRALARMDANARKRIATAIEALADVPRPAGCIKLQGREAWRIRVGEYRVIYEIKDRVLQIRVIALGHRQGIYR